MALVCNPRLLIADEPTTALDVTVQAKIIDLFRGFREQGISIMLAWLARFACSRCAMLSRL